MRRLQHATDALLTAAASAPPAADARDSAGESLDSADSGSESPDCRDGPGWDAAATEKRVRSFLELLDASRWGRFESLVAEGS